MLARQVVLRRAALSPSRSSTQRILPYQLRPLDRRISFLPWRQKKPETSGQPTPVYFAKPNSTWSDRGPTPRLSSADDKKILRKLIWHFRHARFRCVCLDTCSAHVTSEILTSNLVGGLLQSSYFTCAGKYSAPSCSIPYSTGLMLNGRLCQIRKRRKPRPTTIPMSRCYFSLFLLRQRRLNNPRIEVQTQNGKHLSRSARTKSFCRRLRVSRIQS